MQADRGQAEPRAAKVKAGKAKAGEVERERRSYFAGYRQPLLRFTVG